MTLKEFFQSKAFSILLYSMGVILLGFVIFTMGLLMGYHQASVSYRWGENYYRNFVGGPKEGDFQGLGRKEFINGHGLLGTILSITAVNDTDTNGATGSKILVVKDKDNTEIIVLVTPATAIRKDRDTVSLQDLQVSMNIVALGSPNDQGQIEAKLIRIVPSSFLPPQPLPNPPSNGRPPMNLQDN
jgi:hypothetical protein